MDLKGISIKGGGYQNLSTGRMPAEQQRPARRRVRGEILDNRGRNRRKSFGLYIGGTGRNSCPASRLGSERGAGAWARPAVQGRPGEGQESGATETES